MKYIQFCKKVLVTLIILALPSFVLAADIITGENFSPSTEKENPYVFGQNITLDSDVKNDIAIFGQSIDIKSNVGDDVFLFGNSISINGKVGDTLRGAGSSININSSEINGDVLMASSEFILDKESKIAGDLWVTAQSITIDGAVEKNLKVTASTVNINGSIGGDAYIRAEKISLSDGSSIKGNLEYKSQSRIEFNEGLVGGEVSFVQSEDYARERAMSIVYALISLIILSLAILYSFRRQVKHIGSLTPAKYGINMLIGFLSLSLVPLLSVLIMIGISLHLGLLILFIYLGFAISAYGLSAITTGSILQRAINKDNELIDWTTALIGSVVFVGIGFIPIIGYILQFLLFISSFGLLNVKIFNLVKSSQGAQVKSAK